MTQDERKGLILCLKIEFSDGLGGAKDRESNIELFRIITMLLIIAHHYVVNSGLLDINGPIYAAPLSKRSLFLLVFGAWGKTGINCFVLITGYFMCKSHISLKKFIKLLGTVMFYKLVIGLVFLVTGYNNYTWSVFLWDILPFTQVAQNFTGTYLLFYLSIPFLNLLIEIMTEKQHIRLFLLLGFIYILFGTVPMLSVSMNYFSWYIVLYLLASYIRKYPKKIFESKNIWIYGIFFGIAVSVFSVIICTWLAAKWNWNVSSYEFVSDSNSLLAVLTGLCAFMLFKNLKIRKSRFINAASATTFGVLQIHANSSTMRHLLWNGILDNIGAYSSPWLIIHALGGVLIVFTVCSIIEMLRIKIIERPFLRFWDKKGDAISMKIKKYGDYLCERYGVQK